MSNRQALLMAFGHVGIAIAAVLLLGDIFFA